MQRKHLKELVIRHLSKNRERPRSPRRTRQVQVPSAFFELCFFVSIWNREEEGMLRTEQLVEVDRLHAALRNRGGEALTVTDVRFVLVVGGNRFCPPAARPSVLKGQKVQHVSIWLNQLSLLCSFSLSSLCLCSCSSSSECPGQSLHPPGAPPHPPLPPGPSVPKGFIVLMRSSDLMTRIIEV